MLSFSLSSGLISFSMNASSSARYAVTSVGILKSTAFLLRRLHYVRGVPNCVYERKRNLLREKFSQLIGEFRRFLFGDEMAAAGDPTASRVTSDPPDSVHSHVPPTPPASPAQ